MDANDKTLYFINLSDEEKTLLLNYRRLSDKDRKEFDKFIDDLRYKMEKKRKTNDSSN